MTFIPVNGIGSRIWSGKCDRSCLGQGGCSSDDSRSKLRKRDSDSVTCNGHESYEENHRIVDLSQVSSRSIIWDVLKCDLKRGEETKKAAC